MANPRKFSEKIALLNQKEAQETAAFEAIMREVSDVTSRVASASSSVGASPTGSGAPEAPLSVKSAGASPPQSSGKHLHINLGNQFRGRSLPNVNNNANCSNDAKDSSPRNNAIHSIDLKTVLSNLEEMQHNSMVYRNDHRDKNMGVGPIRPRPAEKRHDTSPYSGALYLSPPPPDTWRRTNSDSALHQSANEACQSNSSMPHRRDQHNMSGSGNDDRETHHSCLERPRSSCGVPGINIYPSSQPPGQQLPIGNTGSLPDLSNVHFPSPLHTPLDQEDHSSSTPFSNSPQTSSPTNLSPTSLAQAGRQSFSQDHNPPSALQNHLTVPVNSRYLHTCKQGVALENSTSTSQQDLQSYQQQTAPQQIPTSHSPGHYIYQQPHSPIPPQSPKTSQSQSQQLNSLGSYRTSQPVNRPSPQSSPSLTVQGSPLSYSNNPSAPPSPTGHPGPPSLSDLDQNYYINQAQAAALQQDFEQFTMDWSKFAQQLMDLGCTWTTQIEMDSPVAQNSIGTFMSSPNHTATFTQSDVINVATELANADTGYFSTSPQIGYQSVSTTTTTTTTTQQFAPQAPDTPTIILTDFSSADDLTNPEYAKDLGTAMMGDLGELFPSDDALRQGLDPIDVDGLQMLTDPTMVISDPSAEAHFRLDRL